LRASGGRGGPGSGSPHQGQAGHQQGRAGRQQAVVGAGEGQRSSNRGRWCLVCWRLDRWCLASWRLVVGGAVAGGSVGCGPANTGSRSYGAGLSSQAMPSPPARSLPSAGPGWASSPSGSDGSLRRCAWAAAWDSKSSQFWSSWAKAGLAHRARTTAVPSRTMVLRIAPPIVWDRIRGALYQEVGLKAKFRESPVSAVGAGRANTA
jgi:hypothetical protein